MTRQSEDLGLALDISASGKEVESSAMFYFVEIFLPVLVSGALGIAQLWLINRGINAMENSSEKRSQQHDETMAMFQLQREDSQKRHEDSQKRHEETMIILKMQHEATMESIKNQDKIFEDIGTTLIDVGRGIQEIIKQESKPQQY